MMNWDMSPHLQEPEPVYDIDMGYLLQNVGVGYLGNSPVFWHESNSGYTQWIDEAKVWTKDEAEAQIRSTRGTHQWRMWPADQIYKAAKKIVDIQDLI